MSKFNWRNTLLILSSGLILWLLLAPPRVVTELRFVARHAALATTVVANDLCYGIFLQGRTEDDIRRAELGPYLDPRLSWVRAEVDREGREVRARFFGLFPARVSQRADGSCIRGDGRIDEFGMRVRTGVAADPRPWPEGDGLYPEPERLVPDYEALEAAVAAEFLPTESGIDRGTRSVLVVHRGRLVYERHAPGWDRFAPQNGRSMTKVLTSILAGMMAADRRIGLEDEGLRPEWTDERAGIRLKHLLRMQSGLEFSEANGPGDSATATLMAPGASDFAAGKPLAHPPGEVFNYAAGDAELAIAVVQAASGLDDDAWARYPYEALFEPLGMRRVVLDRDPSGQFIVSTAMHAAAVDWARLGLFLARDGVWGGRRLLPPGWVDFIRTPSPESKCNYGAMVWIRGGCNGGKPSPVFELSGFMGQGVTIVPESETIVVRTGFGPWIMGDLLERIFPALGIEAPTRMAMERR